MKTIIPLFVILVFTLSACGDIRPVTFAPDPSRITPSPKPKIITVTPIIVYPTASTTFTLSVTLPPTLTDTPGPTATFTASPTITETFTVSPTFTITPVPMAVTLLGCDTGFDVTHGMGEVTNAYVIVANNAAPDLTDACVTLSSADEGRVHPDKTACAPSLPRGFQVTFKLTIDTTFNASTIVQIEVKSNQGVTISAGGLACKDIGAFKPAPETIGVLQPIQ